MERKRQVATQREREIFLAGLFWAKKNQLTWEYITYYKMMRRRGEDIASATLFALREWDL